MYKIREHELLGVITFRKYVRSKHYTIRVKGGQIFVSLPVSGSYKEALRFVESYKSVLLKKIKETEPALSVYREMELRKEASVFLPQRLAELASKNEFTYTSVKITKSKTRWGSCSSKKTINLSLYLMLLPLHLIDYVLLHELCHTKHMNHGPNFWLLMERVCKGKAKIWRKELRTYTIP
jgi:Predicted metal-dependent hydrolase